MIDITIYNIIIGISGILGVIFWVRDEQKKAIVSLIVLLASLLLRQMGV